MTGWVRRKGHGCAHLGMLELLGTKAKMAHRLPMEKTGKGVLNADRGPQIGNLWAEGISYSIKIQVLGT